MADISKINPNGTEYDIKDAVARGMVEGSKTATGNPITLTDASESYAEELEVTLEPIQSGSGTPSPSNIRPITGYTEVNVGDVGKNLLGSLPLGEKIRDAGGTLDTANKTVTFTHGNSSVNILEDVDIKENTRYTLILTYKNSGNNTCLRIRYKNSSTLYNIELNNSSNQKTTIVFTTASNASIDALLLTWYTDNSTALYYEESGIFEGVLTASDFAPYKSSTTITTLGRTVYGGKQGVNTGKLTVTHGYVDLGSLNYNRSSFGHGYCFWTTVDGIKMVPSTTTANIKCSCYESSSWVNTVTNENSKRIAVRDSNSNIVISDTSYTDAASFKSAMSGQILVYELATPQNYQLTPQELKLLKQYNYITTNGTTISLKYQPDNVIGEAISVSEEYTDRHFAWKKVGEYYNGDLVTIDGEWSEILLTTYTSINNGYSMSVVYPFALFGVASLTAFNEANGEIALNSTLLDTKYVRMTGLSGAKMHVYVR